MRLPSFGDNEDASTLVHLFAKSFAVIVVLHILDGSFVSCQGLCVFSTLSFYEQISLSIGSLVYLVI